MAPSFSLSSLSNSNFIKMDFPQNPNPNFDGTFFPENVDALSVSDFELSDYLEVEDGNTNKDAWSQDMVSFDNISTGESASQFAGATSRNSNMNCKSGVKKNKVDPGSRVAFKTKTDLDVMDDGFKWRKYGKKMVKNSPNPRNYYKCSSTGCDVKKRIERDMNDASYVITTYEGVHNHESPCVVYYNQMPLMVPHGWTLQASSSHSSSS